MIKAGELDRTITIIEFTESENSFGEREKVWTELATVRAAKRSMNNRDVMKSQGVVNAPEGKFLIRYRAGLKTSQRIIYEEQHYEITAVEEIGRRVGQMIFVRAA